MLCKKCNKEIKILRIQKLAICECGIKVLTKEIPEKKSKMIMRNPFKIFNKESQ
jgi:DNA-directed RNA polymerase subunit RPC12/RpoP